jgi:hypothetical protein
MPSKHAIYYGLLVLLLSLFSTGSVAYQPPTMDQYQQLEVQWFQTLTGKSDQQSPAGYQLATDSRPALRHWQSDRDWGEVWLKAGGHRWLFVQTPHRYFDRHTNQIGQHWLASSEVGLLMRNSVHRYAGRKQTPVVDTDFAHSPYNPMLAVSRALVAKGGDWLIVQLHGFSAEKRQTPAAREADLIISYGARASVQGQQRLQAIKQCLQQTGNWQVGLYPTEVQELGGTRNIIGRNLRQLGHGERFLHNVFCILKWPRPYVNNWPIMASKHVRCCIV